MMIKLYNCDCYLDVFLFVEVYVFSAVRSVREVRKHVHTATAISANY